MRKYKEKFILRKAFYSNFTIVFLILIIIFISKGIFSLYNKYRLTKDDEIFVQKEKKEIEKKLELSQNRLDTINSEEGKEKYIRETYPLKKEGEKMMVIYNSSLYTYNIPKNKSFWMNLKENVYNFFYKISHGIINW